MRNNCRAAGKSSGTGSIHKRLSKTSIHGTMLTQDLCNYFSIDLSQCMDSSDFYAIEAKDKRLLELLDYGSYRYFRYDFEKVLSRCMYNLCSAPKCYIEIAIIRDDNNNIIGLSLIPFDAIRIATIEGHSFFLSKKTNGRFICFKLSTNQYVELEVKGIGVNNNYFRKLYRKLVVVDKDPSTEFIFDPQMQGKFDFAYWRAREEFSILKYPNEIGWYGRNASNSLLSESYLLYRSIRFKQFRKKTLEYLLQRINDGLEQISDKVGAIGRIVVHCKLIDYENEWARYTRGEISASELCDIIYERK